MTDNTIAMGFDEEMQEEKTAIKNKPAKRAPYAIWEVAGKEYKLKLTAADITKLEQKYRRNLLLYLTDDGIPAIADMLTVIQASMRLYNHGMTFLDVQSLYDSYVDEGGDQTALMADVLMPLLMVSGFFTQSQAEILNKEMEDLNTNL